MDKKNGVMYIKYEPAQYLRAATGKEFPCDEKYSVKKIREILSENGLQAWSYPLEEYCTLRERGATVVLVECFEKGIEVLRWYEIPEEFDWSIPPRSTKDSIYEVVFAVYGRVENEEAKLLQDNSEGVFES